MYAVQSAYMIQVKVYVVNSGMIQISFDYFNSFLKSNLKIVFLKKMISLITLCSRNG